MPKITDSEELIAILIKEAIKRKVDHMDEGSLEFYTKTSMQDYYLNVASEEEVEQFIKDHEYLPF